MSCRRVFQLAQCDIIDAPPIFIQFFLIEDYMEFILKWMPRSCHDWKFKDSDISDVRFFFNIGWIYVYISDLTLISLYICDFISLTCSIWILSSNYYLIIYISLSDLLSNNHMLISSFRNFLIHFSRFFLFWRVEAILVIAWVEQLSNFLPLRYKTNLSRLINHNKRVLMWFYAPHTSAESEYHGTWCDLRAK